MSAGGATTEFAATKDVEDDDDNDDDNNGNDDEDEDVDCNADEDEDESEAGASTAVFARFAAAAAARGDSIRLAVFEPSADDADFSEPDTSCWLCVRFEPGRCDKSDAAAAVAEDDDDEDAADEAADDDEDGNDEVEDDDTATLGFASCFLTAYVRSMVRGFNRAREK